MSSGTTVTFWGTRGSIPSPAREHIRYGGNTPCVEVVSGDEGRIVLDAGTGLRELGRRLCRNGPPAGVAICLSHLHWDHIQGLPFFDPLYRTGFECTICSTYPDETARTAFTSQMRPPHFPLRLDEVPGRVGFRQLSGGRETIGGFGVTPFALRHPGGCAGFRIEAGEASLVYATDTGHGDEEHDRTIREMSDGADLLIYDAHFTPAEYGTHKGWGHSTWLEAARIAAEAGVKRLALFHHAPDRDDDEVDAILEAARKEFAGTVAASDGMTLPLPG